LIDFVQRLNVQNEDVDAMADERVVILSSVLFFVNDYEVGAQLDDPDNIGVLRASHVFDIRSLTEPSTGNRRVTPGGERLSDRRNQADRSHDDIIDAVGSR
jgi:hypothetical protein